MPFLRTLTLWDKKETKTRRTTSLQEDGTKKVTASFAAAKELRGGELPRKRGDWGLHQDKKKEKKTVRKKRPSVKWSLSVLGKYVMNTCRHT